MLRQRLAPKAGRPVGRKLSRSSNFGRDGRYLVRGRRRWLTVETVWMPQGDDGEDRTGSDAGLPKSSVPILSPFSWRKGGNHEHQPLRPTKPACRATICVSSQVGCAVNCQFCLTAKLGLQRNLGAGEIAGQVLAVFDRHCIEVGRTA